jgi:Rieske 2Fe-2S family protein
MATRRYSIDIAEAGRAWVPRATLSGADYASAEVFEAERERIWWGDWVCIGRSAEVGEPGEYIVRDLAGESIFVVRNRPGELRGFYNVCSHRGTKFLDDGEATGTVRKAFKCPYHAWSFDLDGRLIATPNVHEDDAFDRSDYPLHDFAVDEYAGFLFVNLTTGTPRPLMGALLEGVETITAYERFRMQDLRPGARIVYEVAANWKIIIENYNECLHCPQIHPELVAVIPLFRFGEVWDDEVTSGGNRMIDGATNFSVTGSSSLPQLPGLDPEDYHMYYGTFEFPNLMVNLHPDSMMSYIAMPRGPNHTTVISAVQKIAERLKDDASLRSEIHAIESMVLR